MKLLTQQRFYNYVSIWTVAPRGSSGVTVCFYIAAAKATAFGSAAYGASKRAVFSGLREKPARLAWKLKRACPLCFVKGYVRKLAASVQAFRGASSVENFLLLDCMANGG